MHNIEVIYLMISGKFLTEILIDERVYRLNINSIEHKSLKDDFLHTDDGTRFFFESILTTL